MYGLLCRWRTGRKV